MSQDKRPLGDEIPWTDEDEAAANRADEALATEPDAEETPEELAELEGVDERIAYVQRMLREAGMGGGSDGES